MRVAVYARVSSERQDTDLSLSAQLKALREYALRNAHTVVKEYIDEFYSANLSQDVVRGMRESASRGFYPGGPVPYGYTRVKVHDGNVQRVKLEPDPATAPVVERIFRECLSVGALPFIHNGPLLVNNNCHRPVVNVLIFSNSRQSLLTTSDSNFR